jgi:hypothetical protein
MHASLPAAGGGPPGWEWLSAAGEPDGGVLRAWSILPMLSRFRLLAVIDDSEFRLEPLEKGLLNCQRFAAVEVARRYADLYRLLETGPPKEPAS